MALSGSLSASYKGYTYKVDWSATQSVAGNYSEVTLTHKLVCACVCFINDIFGLYVFAEHVIPKTENFSFISNSYCYHYSICRKICQSTTRILCNAKRRAREAARLKDSIRRMN